jgi:tripartite-type tricarboxylate transporter receptor subunit TctC
MRLIWIKVAATRLEKTLPIFRRRAIAGLAAAPFIATTARAQPAFPSRPMTLVIPFPAGGPSDVFGRYLAQAMATRLGQSVVAENKSGAAGVTGVDFVAKAGSDAHIMGMMTASAAVIMQHLMPRMPYDPKKDIAPLTLMARVQELLVVNSKLGIDSFKDFVAAAKAKPGKITCGSAGTGGITHLAIELLKHEAGIDVLHVPYRGAAPATNDLIAGTVDSTLLDISVSLAHIRAGTVKALAVTSDTRSPLLPDVPTMRELGLPRVNSDNWYALISPGEALLANRQKIQATAVEALHSKDVVEAYLAQGGVAVGNTPEELAKFIAAEDDKWAEVIKFAHVKLE